MPWSVIRKASETEIADLKAAEEKIKAKHGLPDVGWDMSYWRHGHHRHSEQAQTIDKAQAAYRRAVKKILGGSAQGIAYGYVGFSSK